MCGIAGFFNSHKSEKDLKKMISQLRHRGPDGFGYYFKNRTGLAHARLSIIDLKGGFQPIHNEDKTLWITFNGEIFNYIELREELKRKGHVFYTNTDTEVIIHAYEQYGTRAFSKFNGQFAFALWDEKNQEGYLVRDRVGIHPLFYCMDQSGFYFSSEIKAMFVIRDLRKGLDRKQIANQLTFWATEPGKTVFKYIHEVLPGQYVYYNTHGRFGIKSYWDHSYSCESGDPLQIYNAMKEATEIRLRADVPVGAYLSGGLDSTIIASLVKQNFNNDLRTFSIEFEDEIYDESEYQQAVVKALGVNHTSFKCKKSDISETFEDVIYHAEKPLMRTAPVPMYLLSKHVKESGYKVVLTGEGSDEAFGGYDIFRETLTRAYLRKHGDTQEARKMLTQLYPWMGDRIAKSASLLRTFFDSDIPIICPFFSHEPRWRSASKIGRFFSTEMLVADSFDEFSSKFRIPLSKNSLQKAQYLEWHTLFNGYLISSQGDRMLMSHGVEGRFSFLDPNVIDLANKLRDKDKIQDMDEKHILKQAFAGIIPENVLSRKKQPYMAPDGACFANNTCSEAVNEVLCLKKITDYGYFDPRKVELLRRKFDKGAVKGFPDNMAFIGIISTQLLHSFFVEYYTPAEIAMDDEFIVVHRG